MLKYVILVMSIITIVVILATYLRKYIFMFLKSLIKIDVLSQIVLIILCTIKIRGYVYSTNYISKLKLVDDERLVLNIFSLVVATLIVCLTFRIVKILIKKTKLSVYEKNNFRKDYEYYREMIKNEDIDILSFCYLKNPNMDDVIVAYLLQLEQKGKIKVENNNIKILCPKNELSKFEKTILFGSYKTDKGALKAKIKKDITERMIEKGYLKSLIESDPIGVLLSIMTIITCLGLLFYMFLFTDYMKDLHVLMFLVTYFLTIVPSLTYSFLVNKYDAYESTDLLLETKAKILGLKNLISDFSIINENGINQMKLYEDYVLYAIIFDLKGQLDNESKEMYKIYKSKMFNIDYEKGESYGKEN